MEISADVDLSAPGYPFTATVSLSELRDRTGRELLAGNTHSTGDCDYYRTARPGKTPFTGKGDIQSLQTTIREYQFHEAKPFVFEFDANRLKLTEGATFSGAYRHDD